MKLKIKQSILLNQLSNVIRGISNKNIIPIYSCIKLDLNKDGLFLLSTDEELSMQTFIPKKDLEEIIEHGEIVINGKLFFEIVRKITNDIVSIDELIDSKISIYTDNSSFTLTCNNVSDWPSIDLTPSENPIKINKKVFKNIVSQTIFATSTQTTRPILTGLNLIFDKNTLICTGTDSYRLATKTIQLDQTVEEIYNIVVPTKNLTELVRMYDEDDEDLEISIFDNKVIFRFETIILMSKIINGSYPNTSQLIPKDFSLITKINLRNLYNAIDRASILTNENEKNTIKFETKKDSVLISSNIPEIGYVEENLNISKKNNEEIKIAFSSKYMLDALKAFDCEEVELMFNGEVKPIIIQNPSSSDLIQLILPIRTY